MIDQRIFRTKLNDRMTQLAEQGLIWYEESEGWIGKAADGTEVAMGHDLAHVESYLIARPTPDLW